MQIEQLSKPFFRFTRKFLIVGAVSTLGCVYQSPVFAQTAVRTYVGTDADVTVRCIKVNDQSSGNYTINGTKSGTRTAFVTGGAYFDNDLLSVQLINETSRSFAGDLVFNGSTKDYGFIAINFGAAILATGNEADGSPVVEIPEFADEQFGFTVNCVQ